MGVGKSKLVLDNVARLYREHEIDCLVVIAPNGVHRNWALNEIPVHFPDDIPHKVMTWYSNRAKTKKVRYEFDELRNFKGLKIFLMTFDTCITKAGDAAVQYLFKKFRTFLCIDESRHIKTPNSKRSKRIISYGRKTKYRRILTGTPVGNSAFDVYAQFRAIDSSFWSKHGYRTAAAFRSNFGHYEEEYGTGGRKYESFKHYRNLDELADIMAPYMSRRTKADTLDLPEKIYQRQYVDLTPKQWEVYEILREECLLMIERGEIDVPLAITRLLRFQQIVCGYVVDQKKNYEELPSNRLKVLMDVIDDIGFENKIIVWSRFTHDIDRIVDACNMSGILCVRYDGRVNERDRIEAMRLFQDVSIPDNGAQIFIGNPAAAGEGLTLHAAHNVIYYSNSFKLTERLQSEDRCHRIGQHYPVTYVDLVSADTVDEHIINTLRGHLDVASMVTGDRLKEWL